MGRRAIKTYLAMFVHAAVASSGVGIRELGMLRGKSLEKKIEDMTHVKNLGRSVGGVCGVGKVVRSDENPVSFVQVRWSSGTGQGTKSFPRFKYSLVVPARVL